MTEPEPIEAVVARVQEMCKYLEPDEVADVERLAREVERLQRDYTFRGKMVEEGVRQRDGARADNAALQARIERLQAVAQAVEDAAMHSSPSTIRECFRRAQEANDSLQPGDLGGEVFGGPE